MKNPSTVQPNDPLDKVFVKPEVTAADIARFTNDYLRIERETLQVGFLPNNDISINRKIVLYLLAIKILTHLKMRDSDSATPSEIAHSLDLNHSTVRVELKHLLQSKMVICINRGEYLVPIARFREVKTFIARKRKTA